MLKELGRGLLDLALPPRCAGCRAPLRIQRSRHAPGLLRAVLCRDCLEALEVLPNDRCILCQERSAPPDLLRCAVCGERGSVLTSCLASVVYRDDAERWIRRFKYPESGLGFLRPEPTAIATAMTVGAAQRTPGPRPELVVPVPLHPRRLRERGFNPATVLARAVAQHMGVRFSSRVLVRSRDTPSQTRLSRTGRRSNVRGAFAREPSGPLPKRIWLVDDVVTTGSTLEEAARTLARGTDVEVHAICAGRAPEPGGTKVSA